ncbi:MAG TPA: thioredoxin-dependent thiol peroxidase [Gemmatimonadales bacterium]|nr:thioredoxin-dependent thiol peroxidase [Gemmatimonadales bacterium]
MIGKPAPDFTLPDHNGKLVELSDLRGAPVVLYFYPKDNTPGCTAQACGFRDAFPAFEQLDATILGVSTDSVESHAKFRQRFSLPFTLLSDSEHAVAELYGVWQEKSMFGRKYWGIVRSTFVIAPDGTVAAEMRNVRVRGHAERVQAALEELG